MLWGSRGYKLLTLTMAQSEPKKRTAVKKRPASSASAEKPRPTSKPRLGGSTKKGPNRLSEALSRAVVNEVPRSRALTEQSLDTIATANAFAAVTETLARLRGEDCEKIQALERQVQALRLEVTTEQQKAARQSADLEAKAKEYQEKIRQLKVAIKAKLQTDVLSIQNKGLSLELSR